MNRDRTLLVSRVAFALFPLFALTTHLVLGWAGRSAWIGTLWAVCGGAVVVSWLGMCFVARCPRCEARFDLATAWLPFSVECKACGFDGGESRAARSGRPLPSWLRSVSWLFLAAGAVLGLFVLFAFLDQAGVETGVQLSDGSGTMSGATFLDRQGAVVLPLAVYLLTTGLCMRFLPSAARILLCVPGAVAVMAAIGAMIVTGTFSVGGVGFVVMLAGVFAASVWVAWFAE